MRAPLPLCATLLALAPGMRAQQRPTVSFAGTAAFVWVRSDTAGGAVRLRGPVLAGEGRLALGRVALAAGLLEGRLNPVAAAAAPRDLVEARLAVAARPLPWLEVAAGPVVRAYVADAVTERWVFWQARARADAPIVTARLASYVELWRALSSRLNLASPAGRMQGGEAGLVYRPPRGAWWVRMAYRVDDAAFSVGGGETLEAISFTVGVGGW